VSKSEYAQLRGKDRSVTKGLQYTPLSHRENLASTAAGPTNSFKPTSNVTYLLKESFGQLWDYAPRIEEEVACQALDETHE